MFKVDDSVPDSRIADLLIADADALNAMVTGPDADRSLMRTDGNPAGVQPMSMSRLIKTRVLDEF